MSLDTLAGILSKLGRSKEAQGAAQAALEIVAPFVEKLPQAHSELAGEIEKTYLAACQASGVEADAVLERVERASLAAQQSEEGNA